MRTCRGEAERGCSVGQGQRRWREERTQGSRHGSRGGQRKAREEAALQRQCAECGRRVRGGWWMEMQRSEERAGDGDMPGVGLGGRCQVMKGAQLRSAHMSAASHSFHLTLSSHTPPSLPHTCHTPVHRRCSSLPAASPHPACRHPVCVMPRVFAGSSLARREGVSEPPPSPPVASVALHTLASALPSHSLSLPLPMQNPPTAPACAGNAVAADVHSTRHPFAGSTTALRLKQSSAEDEGAASGGGGKGGGAERGLQAMHDSLVSDLAATSSPASSASFTCATAPLAVSPSDGAVRCPVLCCAACQRSTLTVAVSLLSGALSSWSGGCRGAAFASSSTAPPCVDVGLSATASSLELTGRVERLHSSAHAQPTQSAITLLLLACGLLLREMEEERGRKSKHEEGVGGCEGAEVGGTCGATAGARLRAVLACWRRLQQSEWFSPLLQRSELATRPLPDLAQLSCSCIASALHGRLTAAHRSISTVLEREGQG